MASPGSAIRSCAITVNVFDGARRPLSPEIEILTTIRDGNQHQVYREFNRTSSLTVSGLPFFDNFGDNYTVVAWAPGYEQAGFTPVKASPHGPAVVDLMLLRKDASFNFSPAKWDRLKESRPRLVELLSTGASNDSAAEERYEELLENQPAALACFFNLTAAMAQIHLPEGAPLDYLRALIWDGAMRRDRFFAYADRKLVDQVRLASARGLFAPVPGAALFHPGATCSFKQVQFGDANVQLTFHETESKAIDGVDCIKVEPDMDYHKDLLAHALLEVVPNTVTGSLTDPRQVYVLRWMAGRRAGIPEFDPPYIIA